MSLPDTLLTRLYGLALPLYPEVFRQRYGAEMLEAVRLQEAESPSRLRFALSLFTDTVRSLFEVHMRTSSPTSPLYVFAFAVFFSMALLFISVFNQQVLRRGADRQPAQVVEQVSTRLAEGTPAASLLPADTQEIANPAWLHGSSTFAALYDDTGTALASNATLHGGLPQPPRGIFNVIRQQGEHKVTWQPQPGIRVALTGRPAPGGGFVVAGQSLIPSESREAAFRRWMLVLWFAMIVACVFIATTAQSRRTPQSI
jgi:hypothetical protein